jgi:hypothetical protein
MLDVFKIYDFIINKTPYTMDMLSNFKIDLQNDKNTLYYPMKKNNKPYGILELKLSELPKELEFVLIELAIQRYNKIGSEGIASESVDGRTTSYEDDFESYKQYLDDYINKNKMVKGFRLI